MVSKGVSAADKGKATRATPARSTRAVAAKVAAPSQRAKRGTGASLNGERARDREVIETAVRIFWEKGYASASVQDVADALGMLKGSLYYYIDSKESLLRKIFEDSHSEIVALTEVVTDADGSAMERLDRFLRDYAMWTLTHLERAGLYSREWRYAGPTLKATLTTQQKYYDAHLRHLIVAGQSEGDLDPQVDPRRASAFIWAAYTGLPDWFRATGPHSADEVASTYVDLALRAAGRYSSGSASTTS